MKAIHKKLAGVRFEKLHGKISKPSLILIKCSTAENHSYSRYYSAAMPNFRSNPFCLVSVSLSSVDWLICTSAVITYFNHCFPKKIIQQLIFKLILPTLCVKRLVCIKKRDNIDFRDFQLSVDNVYTILSLQISLFKNSSQIEL